MVLVTSKIENRNRQGVNTLDNSIFNSRVLKEKYDAQIEIDKYIDRRNLLEEWATVIETGAINNLSEVQIRSSFINDIFIKVLRYSNFTDNTVEWNILEEQKTKSDATKADLVLGFFSPNKYDYQVAVELKSPYKNFDSKQLRKNDNRTPVEQGFSYLPKYGKNCKWLIATNYK